MVKKQSTINLQIIHNQAIRALARKATLKSPEQELWFAALSRAIRDIGVSDRYNKGTGGWHEMQVHDSTQLWLDDNMFELTLAPIILTVGLTRDYVMSILRHYGIL